MVQELVRQIDVNQDGAVDLEEFIDFVIKMSFSQGSLTSKEDVLRGLKNTVSAGMVSCLPFVIR